MKFSSWLLLTLSMLMLFICGLYVFESRELINCYLIKYENLISFVFQLLTVVVALATAIIAVAIQKKTKNDRQIETSVDCIQYWRSNEFSNVTKEYDSVLKKKEGNFQQLANIKNRKTNDFKAVHDYLTEFEKVSIKVNTKVYDESVIYDQLGIIMYMQYQFHLKAFIEGVHTWSPGIYKNTENLMIKWQKKASKDSKEYIKSQKIQGT